MNVDLLGLFVFGSTLDLHVNLNCVHITYEYMGRIKKQFLSRTKNTKYTMQVPFVFIFYLSPFWFKIYPKFLHIDINLKSTNTCSVMNRSDDITLEVKV